MCVGKREKDSVSDICCYLAARVLAVELSEETFCGRVVECACACACLVSDT